MIVLNILVSKVTESYHSGIRTFIDSLYDNYNSKCPSSAHNDDNDGKLTEPEERGGESYAECWLASPHHHGTQLTPASCHHARCTQVGGGGGRDALSPGMWHRQPHLTIVAFLACTAQYNNIKPDLIQLFVLTKPQLSRSPEYAALHV